MGRPGSNAGFVGPVVAEDETAARRVILSLLSGWAGRPMFWDILPRHEASAALARELGFEPLRRLMRMALPLTGEAGQPMRVWATAGFEYG